MRLLSRLQRWAYPSLPPAEQLAARAGGLVATYQVGKPQWPKREVGVYETQGYSALALGFACVGIVADVGSAVPLRVYEEQADGTRPTLPNHAMAALMRRPNPEMWQGEFLWQVLMTAAVAGFCVVEKVRSAAGRVVELWPLDPSRLRAVPRNQAPPDWRYKVGSTEIELKAEDVLVYRWRTRMGRSPFGIGPFEVLFREIGLQNAMQDFLKSFFDNGAMSQQLVVVDTLPGQTLDQDQKDALEESFLRKHGGLRNAWRPIFTGGIKEVKDIGFDFQELAWEKLRDLNDLAICQAFGMPASMAQVRVGLENATNRANIEADELRLYRQVIIPQLARLDGVLTLGLLAEFEPPGSRVSLEFDYSDVSALQGDRNARATALNPVLLAGGIPVSVYCAETGLPAPEIDFYLRPINIEAIPADDPLMSAAPPLLAQPQPPPQLGAIRLREIGAGPSARLARRKAIGAANKALIANIAAARQPSIAAFFQAQGKRFIAAVTAPVGIAALAVANGHARETLALADFDWAPEDGALRDNLMRLWALAGETAFASASDLLGVGIDFTLSNPRVLGLVNRLGTRVVGINEETRRDIARVVTEGETAGKTLDAIADDLTGLFEESYQGRSLTIARTESQVSLNLAGGIAWKESGVCDRAQLFDNPLHDTDPGSDGLTCAQRNGLIVPLDDLEKHVLAEHPSGTLAAAPVLIGED